MATGAGLASVALMNHGPVTVAGRQREAPVASPLYSQSVISLGPVGYWRLGDSFGAKALDWSGNQNVGIYHGSPRFGEPGAIRNDANAAIGLNGASYVEIPSRWAFSIGGTGLTVQAWLRPEQLNFTCQANAEYIHWLGKGEAGSVEWGFRFYRKNSSRPNRISAYVWNPDGKLGAGAYFQEPVVPGQWIEVVAVYQPPGNNAGVSIVSFRQAYRTVFAWPVTWLSRSFDRGGQPMQPADYGKSRPICQAWRNGWSDGGKGVNEATASPQRFGLKPPSWPAGTVSIARPGPWDSTTITSRNG